MFTQSSKHLLIAASLATSLLVSCLTGCGGSSNSSTSNNNSNSTVTGNDCYSTNSLGITQLPDSSSSLYKTTFCKYLGLTAPNGKTIGFYAQQNISDEQLVRAQRILGFYLQGHDAVANRMADNQAHMMLLNGADGDNELADNLQGQPLYEKEMITEGSVGYLSADLATYRDASFEEILHLVHDYGIGTESQPGADMDYSRQIKHARQQAMTQNIWPSSGVDQGTRDWIKELQNEGSLSQEYLASVLDSYYGLWQTFSQPGGMWGIYSAKSRADIQSLDPLGFAAMEAFFQPNLTYMARIDAEFSGTFSLQLDNNQGYTYKSQYLTHARLTGAQNSNLLGNDLNNHLAGNSGSNILDGAAGEDTLLLQGLFAEYSIEKNGDGILIQDSVNERDGSITIQNIEKIQFKDRNVNTSAL